MAQEIACFSYDEDHKLHLDDSSLKYYHTPHLPADLSAGFESFRDLQKADKGDEHLTSLLATITDLEQRTGEKCDTDVVTWRGMMTKIMAAPFDRFNSFEMNATCFQGTIFVEEDHQSRLEEKQQQMRKPGNRRPDLPAPELMAYWGYKFEALSVIPDVWDNVSREQIENRDKDPVSNYAQYCSVVKTGIGGASLILGGEVDAVWDRKPEDPEQPIKWVELKTNEQPQSDADMLKYERKLLKHWVQSFLLGVPKIIVGFRNRDGILQRLEEMDTQSIPGQVKRVGKNSWDGNVCINFAAAFLDFLRNTITGEGTWRISRKERSNVVDVYKTSDKGYGNILSPAFVSWREQLLARQVAKMLV